MEKYLIVIEKTDGEGFGAYSPDLPGCYATGKSLETVERRMMNAIKAHIDQHLVDGKIVPEPKTVAAFMLAVSAAGTTDSAA